MADVNKLISLANLQSYDTLIKRFITDADAVVDAKSIKNVAVVGDSIYFFKQDTVPTVEDGGVDVSKAVAKVDISSSDVEQLLTDVEELQGTLTGYSSTSTVASAIAAAQKAAEDAVDALERGAVATNAAAIQAINNTETGILAQAEAKVKALADGAVAANTAAIASINDTSNGVLKQAKDYTDAEVKKVTDSIGTVAEGKTVVGMISDAETTVTGLVSDEETRAKAAEKANTDAISALDSKVGFTPSEEEGAPQTVKAYVDAEVTKATGNANKVAEDLAAEIERATGAEGDLQDAIDAHKEAIDGVVSTLVGDDANKSVRTIANEELAAQLIPEDAKESLDTLKEIADWIQAHPDDASAMNTAIGNLETLVGTLPSDVTATTIVGLIQELVAAEETRATGVEEGLDDRLEAIEAKFEGEGSVESLIATAKSEAIAEAGTNADTKISTAIDGLDSEKSQTAGADGLALNIKIEDGKVTEFGGSIAANTYDAYGAAKAVQDDLDNYKYVIASAEEINKLFSDEEVTE